MASSSSTARVQTALHDKGFDFRIVELSSGARTAEEAATALGCTKAQIAKSLVFKTAQTGKPVLVLASGINRVDEKIIAAHVGEAILKADPAFVRDVTGYAIGGIPPIGHAETMQTFIDEDLLTFPDVWAAAGTPHTVVHITTKISSLVPDAQVIALKHVPS